MRYTNPVILSDYSDPDVIRVGDDFYMVASSFNHVPCVPVLHSKNLVEWELINYVMDEIPFPHFDEVCHGRGVWAVSLRFHNGKFYCLIPFPDEGIFVSETDDPRGKWSPPRPLLTGKGYEDPCPIWADGKCFVVFAFVKSRIGFNSLLAVFETDEELNVKADGYKIIYDGHDIAPKIEGPKFYKHGGYYYILAPAGGVQTGWQVALRSKEIYGEYETKIIMVQGDTEVNGPHQGALVDLDDGGKKWAFIHFQDMGPYGRVIHLQPAIWLNEWILTGKIEEESLPASPVEGDEYPIAVSTGYRIDASDEFNSEKLSLIWQTPANRKKSWYGLKDGLRLFCVKYDCPALSDLPQLFMQKVQFLSFDATAECKLNFASDGDEAGFTVFGRNYAYVCAVRRNGADYIEIRTGQIGGNVDEVLFISPPCEDETVSFKLCAKYEERHRLSYKFFINGKAFNKKFYAERGVWTGAKIGVYARSSAHSTGSATFKYFRVTDKTNK